MSKHWFNKYDRALLAAMLITPPETAEAPRKREPDPDVTPTKEELLRRQTPAYRAKHPLLYSPMSPAAEREFQQAIREPIGQIGRLARILHSDGTESRKFCFTQAEAVEWIQRARKSTDDIVIENAPRPKDINCNPYPRQMTHADRVFLNDCGIFLHMLSWRDSYYRKAKERRESGEDMREFEELL